MRATLVRPRLASIPLLAGCFTAAIIAVEVAAPAPRGVVVGAQLTLIVCLGAAIAVAALRRRFAWPLLIVAALALGSWRGAAALATTLQPWSGAPSVPIEMVGSVEQPPEPRGSTLAVLVRPAEITNPAGIAAPAGLVQLALPALEPVDYGDRLVIVGQFQPVEGGASSGRRQLASGVVATSLLPATAVIGHNGGNSALAALFAFRQRLQGAAAASLPEPYATLVMGMILGIVGGVPDSLRLGLVASGTTHMLVVSGYNISLVAAALRRSFGRIRGTRLLVPLVGVWAFTLMTGAGAPSLRAALMATVALAARGTGRGRDALAALVLACALMLGFDPLLATNLGFELSALATLGLIALEPRVAALLTRLSPVLREPLAATLAAELATSPLLATTFHQVTPASPIANAVLAPLVPIITVAGAGLLPLVAILPFLAPLAGLILFVPSWAFVEVVTLTAAIPRVVQPVGEIPAGILVLYAAALLVWAGWATPEGQDLRAKLAGAPLARRAGYGAAAGLIAAIVLGTTATAATAALRIDVLDVGGDDAVLVRTPAGRTILIDGGSDPTALLTQLGQRLGLLDRNLTVAILTRADAAHVPGLTAAAGRFPPALVVLPPEGSNSAAYTQLLGIASQTKTLTADSGMTIEIEPGVSLELTPTRPLPGPANDATPPLRSLAVRIVDRGVTVLVAPGLTAPGIHDLAAGGWPLRADAWLMPYHGDRVALDSEALANIDPTVAIIAVGPRDRANHPAPAVLDLLRDRQLFRTDLQGTITIETDGSRLEISTERIAPGRT